MGGEQHTPTAARMERRSGHGAPNSAPGKPAAANQTEKVTQPAHCAAADVMAVTN